MDEMRLEDITIVGVACMDFQNALHVTGVNIPLSEVVKTENALVVNNLIFPLDWYKAIELCDEKQYEKILNHRKS
jgi:hypothetical protein